MKKYLFACIVIAFTVSCAKEKGLDIVENKSEGEIVAPAGERVTISAALPEDLLTKVSFVPTILSDKPTGMALTWATGDQIRVYNHADHSQYEDFTLDPSCDGQKKGIFNGTAISASSYDIEVINPALTVGTQVQAADGDTGHLKYYASVEDVPSYDSITFTDLSSVLALTAKMPSPEVAASITSVDVTASENIFGTGNTLTLTLTTPGSADDILHLFANLPMGTTAIPASTTLIIHFNSNQAAHSVYTRYVELAEGNFAAGKLNTININASQSGTHAGPTSCDGTTAANAYLIGDKYQMLAVASELVPGGTRYFKMIDDVDMDGLSWTALNNSGSFDKGIYFDGGGCTISNLTVTSGAYPSFVGVLNGTVKDLVFDNAQITAGNNTTGVLAGYIGSSSSSVTGNISGITVINSSITGGTKTRMGGIAGYANVVGSTISNCHVDDLTLSSTNERVGGLFGQVDAGVSIVGCTTNSVTATSTASNNVGGLIGVCYGNVTDCSATNVTVRGVLNIGGLVGYLENCTVLRCSSTGTASSSNTTSNADICLGGLVGEFKTNAVVSNCYSSVNINQTSNGRDIGGLVGRLQQGTIEKSYATGNVSGMQRNVAGLVGCVTNTTGSASIRDSYCTGTVVGTGGHSGGLVGLFEKGNLTIERCYSTSAVSGNFGLGGIIGYDGANTFVLNDCAAWNPSVTPANYGQVNWSSGAIIGVTSPNCNASNNYRKPGMSLTCRWIPDADYDHADIEGTTHPLVQNSQDTPFTFAESTATAASAGASNVDAGRWGYHGKHSTTGILSTLASTAKGSGGLGWSGDVWDFTADLPTLK